MSADAEQDLRRDAPGAAHAAPRWLRVPGIEVRRAEGAAARLTRPRFAWNMGEVSGSLGDLFQVHLMAAIGVALNPAAAFAVGLPIA